MEWLVAVISVAVTILIFVITGFSKRVKSVDEKVEKYEERLRQVEGAVIEMRTENEAIIKRLDRIETKIDDLGQALRQ
jgi:uncharacterized protein YoxC